MVKRLWTASAPGADPFENLALEEALLHRVERGACILYLWQNQKTVVIGRNQNAWRECRVEALEADGGLLARRLSGGGAVFHDLGNLNFTFLVRQEDYDVSRQLSVLALALAELGVPAEKSGRNDVTVEGRKVSGNAFYRTAGRCCHHGTVLIRTDRGALERYLKVPAEKLRSKGVASVQGRVANLCDFLPEVTVEGVRGALCAAFQAVYGLPAEQLSPEPELAAETAARRERFASWEWRFGRDLPFTTECSGRYGWGGVTLRFWVERGRVAAARAETDALDADGFAALGDRLTGLPFTAEALCGAVDSEELRELIGSLF